MTNPTDCKRCGQPHRGCTAHTKRTGGPCGNRPAKGATVCVYHGAKAPQVQAAIARRAQEAAAREAVIRFGLHADTDAHRQMARLINISAGLVSYYEWQCTQLDPDALIWGDTEVRVDFRGTAVTQRGEVNTWLRLFNEERKELRALCSAAITAGLAEREVRLAEQHGALIAETLRNVLARLELTQDQQTVALRIVPEYLREIGGRMTPLFGAEEAEAG